MYEKPDEVVQITPLHLNMNANGDIVEIWFNQEVREVSAYRYRVQRDVPSSKITINPYNESHYSIAYEGSDDNILRFKDYYHIVAIVYDSYGHYSEDLKISYEILVDGIWTEKSFRVRLEDNIGN